MSAKHVEAVLEVSRDAGSIPAASTSSKSRWSKNRPAAFFIYSRFWGMSPACWRSEANSYIYSESHTKFLVCCPGDVPRLAHAASRIRLKPILGKAKLATSEYHERQAKK